MRELRIVKASGMLTEVNLSTDDDGSVIWKFSVDDGLLPMYLGNLIFIISFGPRFPFMPPEILIRDIFHPNVYEDGRLCMSLLDSAEVPGGPSKEALWRVSLSMSAVLSGVLDVLREPNPESAANVEAAKLFLREQEEYCSRNLKLKALRDERKEKEAQDRAYFEALAEDQKIEEQQVAYEREKSALEMKKKIDEEERNAEQARHDLDQVMARCSLPPEPAADCGLPIANIRFRTPSGLMTRRFLASQPLSVLLLYLQSQGYRSEQYKVLVWPRRDLSNLPTTSTLSDLKLVPQETLTLEAISHGESDNE